MTDLRRLLDENSDELALELLRSAGDDSPSGDSLKAAALALGISGTVGSSALLGSGLHTAVPSAAASGAHAVVAGAPAGSAAIASITLGAIVKQVAIGIAAGVLTMGGVQLVSEQPSNSDAKATQGSVSSLRHAATPAQGQALQLGEPNAFAALAAVGAPAQPSPDAVAAAPVVRRRSAPTDSQGRAPKVADEAAPPVSMAEIPEAPLAAMAPEVEKAPVALNKSLAAEVALLDRARNALLAQNPSGALRALEQYRRERQTAILEPEASVLQIHVLDKLGEHAAAVSAARRFVQTHPGSPQADSLRALAAEE